MGRIGLIAAAVVLAMAAGAHAGDMSPKDVFDLSAAHRLEIRLSADAWDSIQPGNGARKIAANATREQAKTAGVAVSAHAGSYAFVLGEMDFDGGRLPDVGGRFK